MSAILGIDPGNEKSGWVLLDSSGVCDSGVEVNSEICYWLSGAHVEAGFLAIERIQGYGMAVGREVFETCEWVGRFAQTWNGHVPPLLIYRREVKLYLCGSVAAKDANVRQALIDRFPAVGGGKTPQIGTKAQPGPLYGISSHAWSALAVAITAEHQIKEGKC